MSKGFKIELDDQFVPKFVRINSDTTQLDFAIADGKRSDNSGGGGRITLFDKEEDNQITIYLPKSAIAAIREVFRNGGN